VIQPADRALRVLFVTNDLGRGGAERQMLALSRGLPAHGIQPAFILIGEGGEDVSRAVAAGVEVTVLGVPSWHDGAARFLFGWMRGVIRHLRAARRGHFDLADAWLYQGYWLTALTYRMAGIGVFVAGRRSLSDFKDGWRWPARMIDRFARGRARLLVANSEAVRRDVIRREGIAPGRITVIRNGVEIPSAPTDADRHDVRAAWGLGADEFVIGCVANLKPGKGIEHLVRAFASLRPSGEDAHLVLVGEGPLHLQFVELARRLGVASRIHFHGTDTDPTRLLPGIDVFVHPSESEGLPNAVLEAAAAGLPIVATDAGGTGEIVQSRVTGILVPVGAIDAMATAIEELRADRMERERLGIAAREHARKAFGMERFVSETAALYRRLAAAGSGRSGADERPGGHVPY